MLSIAGLCLAIAGCGGQPIHVSKDGPPMTGPGAIDRVADVEVRNERVRKAGNPATYVVFGKRYYVMNEANGYKKRGYASWYGKKFHGRKTSNGEIYDMYKMTAAHKTLPIPCYVRVTNLENGRKAILRVNDRGPFHEDRIIDLSYSAAWKLGVLKKGTAMVEVEVVTKESLAEEKRLIEAKANPPPAATPAVYSTTAAAPVETLKVSTTPVAAASSVAAIPAPVIQTGFGYYLQAGAFRFKDNAALLESRLRQAGLGSAGIQTQLTNDIYRVRLGPYSDEAQLQHDHERLAALGIKAQTIKPQQ